MNDQRRRFANFLDQPIGALRTSGRLLALTISAALFLAVIGVIVFAVGLSFTVTNLALASQPATCANCHEVNLAHDQWASSSHRGVACLNCHMEPSLQGFVSMNFRAASHLVEHLTGNYDTPIRTTVEDASCLKCHPKDSRPEVIPQFSLRIAHSKHVDQACADCHGRLVHRDAVDTPAPTMASAHNTLDCKVCHAQPQPEYIHSNPDVACSSCHSANIPRHEFATSEGIMPRASCQECHTRLRVVGSPDECQTCHVSPHKVDLRCSQCHKSSTSWNSF